MSECSVGPKTTLVRRSKEVGEGGKITSGSSICSASVWDAIPASPGGSPRHSAMSQRRPLGSVYISFSSAGNNFREETAQYFVEALVVSNLPGRDEVEGRLGPAGSEFLHRTIHSPMCIKDYPHFKALTYLI